MSEREYSDGDPESPDDPFAHLFRPDPFGAPTGSAGTDLPDAPVAESADPLADWEPLMAVPTAADVDPPLPPSAADVADDVLVEDVVVEEIIEESAEVEAEPTPLPPADPLAGRLFRSRGAPETADAVTAIGSMQARRLRTMARANEPMPVPEIVEEVAVVEEMPAPAFPEPASGEPAPALQVMNRPVAAPATPEREPADSRRPADRGTSGSLTGLGVYAVTTGVTVILAFGQVLFFGGTIGAIAGIGLLVVSVFAAFAVRVRDSLNAIFAPPIAFLIATLTAGQVGVNANGLSGRAVEVFFLLGENWMWIIGSTVAALIIVALRRRFS